jgi:hypothetical protein
MYFVDGKYSLFTQGLGREVMVKGADVEEDKIEGIWAGAKVEYDEDPVLQVGIGRPRH